MIENLPNGYVLFCDDVRMEIGSKPSFMGVYTSGMVVNQPFPFSLQRLTAWVTYWHKIDLFPDKLTIRVWFPGDAEDTPSASFEIDGVPLKQNVPEKTIGGKPARKIAVRAQLAFTPANFKESGIVRVVASSSNGEEIELGKLEVVSQMPASQTPAEVVPTEVGD